MSNYLYTYFINFFLWLLIDEMFVAIPLKRKNYFWFRAEASLIGSAILGLALVELVKKIPQELYWVSLIYYLIVFVMTMVMLKFCLEAEAEEILFVGTAGYAIQHISYASADIVNIFLKSFGFSQEVFPYKTIVEYALCILIGYCGYRFLVCGVLGKMKLKKVDSRMIIICLMVLMASVVLSVFIPNADNTELVRYHIICRLYAILACILGLAIQFNLSIMNQVEADQKTLEQLLHMEEQQHKFNRDTIEQINIKCHDLKHQLNELRNMDDRIQRLASIDEISSSVDIYDNTIKTGNETLDLVMTEKSLISRKYAIKLSCILDGKLLNFMKDADNYALFSNAMDNAIESVCHSSEEYRVITIRLTQVHQMIMLHMDNRCETPLVFEDGMPQTIAEDKKNHGYGTKSISYIVKKYGGEVHMDWDEKIFYLNIVFPLQVINE